MSATTVRAIRAVLEAGRVGETYNVGGWNEKTNLEVVAPSAPCSMNWSPRGDGQLLCRADHLREGPPRPRPALRHRRRQDRTRARLDAGRNLRDRHPQDRALVPRQSGLGARRDQRRQRKGIILAGGSGTRLYPATLAVSKQLLPIYDKPMIYYPLTTLMLAGIRDILIISTPQDTPRFEQLLGDGSQWGSTCSTRCSPARTAWRRPSSSAPISSATTRRRPGAGRQHLLRPRLRQRPARGRRARERRAPPSSPTAVNDPERYGVVEFDAAGRAISLEEKPKAAQVRYAVTGLYFYDNRRGRRSRRNLKPSPRGELEITDVNRAVPGLGALKCRNHGPRHAWLDTGTHESLLEAGQFIATIESARASRSPARKRSPGARATSTPMRAASSSKAGTTRSPSPSTGSRFGLRAGQPFPLGQGRAARPALPDRASPGQTGAGGAAPCSTWRWTCANPRPTSASG
jgi:glucose-1-phosphate thymidylyltransferase